MKLFTFILIALAAFVNAAPNSLRKTQKVAQEESRGLRPLNDEEEVTTNREYNEDGEYFEFEEDEEALEFDEDEEDEEEEEGNKVSRTRAHHGKKYYNYHNKACRTRHGSKGKEGHDYIKVHSYNCQATCDKYSFCKGYESGPHGHCELWKYRPQKVASKHGFKCALEY